jgi:hypothetical protein
MVYEMRVFRFEISYNPEKDGPCMLCADIDIKARTWEEAILLLKRYITIEGIEQFKEEGYYVKEVMVMNERKN